MHFWKGFRWWRTVVRQRCSEGDHGRKLAAFSGIGRTNTGPLPRGPGFFSRKEPWEETTRVSALDPWGGANGSTGSKPARGNKSALPPRPGRYGLTRGRSPPCAGAARLAWQCPARLSYHQWGATTRRANAGGWSKAGRGRPAPHFWGRCGRLIAARGPPVPPQRSLLHLWGSCRAVRRD